MLSIIGFLIVLGPLVIFHELGHYLFARLFNVKAEVFSVGFGPVLWSKMLGETELRLSVVPLGGFVKLLGEDGDKELTEEEKKRSLTRQVPWKRFFIFLGGPLFNLILAIMIFMVILVIGEEQMASVIGRSVKYSAAEKAGFISGDKVVSINGSPIKKFEEIVNVVSDNPGKPLVFEVIHPGLTAPKKLEVIPHAQEGFSVYGEKTNVGEIDGLLPMARSTTVGISNPNSLAAKAGFSTGDKIVEINGRKYSTYEEIEDFYSNSSIGTTFAITGQSKTDHRSFSFRKSSNSLNFAQATGLYSSELFIDKTVAASPAEKAGLKPGDRLIGIGSSEVQSFFELKDAVQRSGENEASGGKVFVKWERAGQIQSASITPTATEGRDPVLKKTIQYTIGVVPQLVWAEPVTVLERVWNPFTLVYQATERMVVFSWRNLVSIGKMFRGEVPLATLGGPILIGKIAGESLTRGLRSLLTTMAIISVGLGVLNLLPIPVLDGGHLLLLGIESIRGRPLTLRQMEIIQQVGLSLILLLMVVVIRNDLARLPFFD